jgi:hypothetical protein
MSPPFQLLRQKPANINTSGSDNFPLARDMFGRESLRIYHGIYDPGTLTLPVTRNHKSPATTFRSDYRTSDIDVETVSGKKGSILKLF